MTGSTTADIRTLLFEKVQAEIQKLQTRLSQAASHATNSQHSAVIGALEGADADLQRIRNLMLLARDCFPPEKQEGGIT